MNNVLKPCPFCGGEADVIEHRFHGLDSSYGLCCKECKAETYQFYDSKEEAIEAWNRRAGKEDKILEQQNVILAKLLELLEGKE